MFADQLPLDGAAVRALLRRPTLWPTAIRAGSELAPTGWWRHAPFLPLPDPDWIHFRMVTAYGGDGSEPMGARELITWLEWKRSFGR
jgi:hypothetical protein